MLSRLQDGKIGPDSRDSVIQMVAALGNPNELRQLFQLGVSATDARHAAVLAALLDAARRRGDAGRPSGDLTLLLPHVDGDPVAVRLAGRWQLQPARENITALANSPETPNEMFMAAVESLAAMGGAASGATLQRIAADDASLPRRTAAAAALAALDLPLAAGLAAEILTAKSLGASLPTIYLTRCWTVATGPRHWRTTWPIERFRRRLLRVAHDRPVRTEATYKT